MTRTLTGPVPKGNGQGARSKEPGARTVFLPKEAGDKDCLGSIGWAVPTEADQEPGSTVASKNGISYGMQNT